ncbi:hypothetical protein EV356DRAFT_503420 [Viridothelium virens]|uniref:Uncharacterized protein n=1 Tax=Viridothelium virens TaxID=1048519 RepID=A0A6A6H6B1_VIRVR|nr:hypothetical protein EV356DRAFT_503420 [Viridothelium virens]
MMESEPKSASEATPSAEGSSSDTPKPRKYPYNHSSAISVSDWATLALGVLGLIGTFIFGAWAIKSYNAAETGNIISSQSLQAALDPHQLQALNLNNQLLLNLLCSIGNNVGLTICGQVTQYLPLSAIASSLLPFSPTLSTSLALSSASATTAPSSGRSTLPLSSTLSTSAAASTASASATPSSVVATSLPTSIPTAPSPPAPSNASGGSLSLGAIIGIIVACVTAVTSFGLLIYWRRQRSRGYYSDE